MKPSNNFEYKGYAVIVFSCNVGHTCDIYNSVTYDLEHNITPQMTIQAVQLKAKMWIEKEIKGDE